MIKDSLISLEQLLVKWAGKLEHGVKEARELPRLEYFSRSTSQEEEIIKIRALFGFALNGWIERSIQEIEDDERSNIRFDADIDEVICCSHSLTKSGLNVVMEYLKPNFQSY